MMAGFDETCGACGAPIREVVDADGNWWEAKPGTAMRALCIEPSRRLGQHGPATAGASDPAAIPGLPSTT